MVCLWSSTTAQNLPEYSSTVESKEDLVTFKIQALPQSATRYHFSETDRKTTSGPAFIDIQIEDDFSLTPVSFSEGVIGVKFEQGREMWKRIFIVEEGLPEKWNELIWPELLLSIDAESGKITLMNGSEVQPFITARLEELDHQLKTVKSQKNLSFMMDQLRPMVKDNESLCFWLTQPPSVYGTRHSDRSAPGTSCRGDRGDDPKGKIRHPPTNISSDPHRRGWKLRPLYSGGAKYPDILGTTNGKK